MTDYKKFDLNIESILEHWKVSHAIREIIANAIDEQLLTNTQDIQIWKEQKLWKIQDFGRGLQYEHLTQNEDEEKVNNPNTIGKFGIGLKDTLATFHRNGVDVLIKSKFNNIKTGLSHKSEFEDILTLHAYIYPPSNPEMSGTLFILQNITDEDIESAKQLFVRFSNMNLIEKTKYGEIFEKNDSTGKIFINGVFAAKEDNYLFNYNVTSLTKKIKDVLNRERNNVARSAYSDRIADILLSCKSKEVANYLVDDLKNFASGTLHDEVKRISIQEHAVKILNAQEKVVFFTPDEISDGAMMVDEAKSAGYDIISIPSNLRDRIRGKEDNSGNLVRDFTEFTQEYSKSFEYQFIEENELSKKEKKIFYMKDNIFNLIGGKPSNIKKIKISEKMKRDTTTFKECEAVYDPLMKDIIIKRNQLKKVRNFAGTLLHEIGHAISRNGDVSRDFELELTRLLGLITAKILKIGKS